MGRPLVFVWKVSLNYRKDLSGLGYLGKKKAIPRQGISRKKEEVNEEKNLRLALDQKPETEG